MSGLKGARWAMLGLWATVMTCAPVASWAADEPTPGPNPLKLPVERLEQSTQKEVRGDPASAMLFDTKDADRLAAAQRAGQQARADKVGELFVTKSGQYVPAKSTGELFAPSRYRAPAATSMTDVATAATDSLDQGGGPWGNDGWLLGAGAGAALIGGVVASARMARSRTE